MKTYEVTLARLAWIKGSVTVKAETWGDAFVKAKTIEDRANWPVDENGDNLIGFGEVEIDSAYCPSESDGHHEGEAPAADVQVYRAAPALASALQRLVEAIKIADDGHCQVKVRDIADRYAIAADALLAAGLPMEV